MKRLVMWTSWRKISQGGISKCKDPEGRLYDDLCPKEVNIVMEE